MFKMSCVLAVVGLVLAGCTDGGSDSSAPPSSAAPDPAMTRIEAGMCFSGTVKDEDDVAPDPATSVGCDDPHSWETIAVLDIPARFLKGSTDEEKLANRTELAKTERSKFSQRFAQKMFPRCYRELWRVTGVDAISDEDLYPTGRFGSDSVWLNVTPPQQWTEGTPQAICSVFFHGATPDSKSERGSVSQWKPLKLTSDSSETITSGYLTGGYPVSLRQCSPGSCTKRHDAEVLWRFNARAVFAKDFLAGQNPKAVDNQAHQEILRFCGDALRKVRGNDAISGAAGWRFYDEDVENGVLDDDEGVLMLGCSYLRPGNFPAGWHAWNLDGRAA